MTEVPAKNGTLTRLLQQTRLPTIEVSLRLCKIRRPQEYSHS